MKVSILFLLASLGVVNGFLVGSYLIIKKSRSVADRYFGGLLLALSIRIGKSVLHYFIEDVDLLIRQIGLSACIFIGPFFYLYLKSLYRKAQVFETRDKALLWILLIIIAVVGVIYPYRNFPSIWNDYVIYGIYGCWVTFVLIGVHYAYKMLKNTVLNPMKMSGNQQYLVAVVLAMVFITTTYQLSLLVRFTYIWGALIFSFSFYYLLGRALIMRSNITPRNPSKTIENGAELLERVNVLMKKEKPFINPKLKLDDLAKEVDLSRHMLSQLLNEEYESGFSHYVKEYRVKEAKQLIATRSELSLEGIGYEAGFNSKSAFFEAFKKIENRTPAEFKKSVE